MKFRILLLTLLIISIIGVTYFYYTPKGNNKIDNNKPIEGTVPNIPEEKPLIFNISDEQFKQGDYIKITINNIGDNKLKIENNIASSISNEIYINGNNGYCYIPVAITEKLGNYIINILNNDSIVKTYNISVVAGTFGVQHLTISQDVLDRSTSSEAMTQYNAAIKEARSYNVKEKLFEDTFLMPVEGEITTQFGLKRYTNNNPTPSRHYGIDIANAKGTPIKATASGKVVFANFILSAGNYIIIDHGMGLYSYYAHMNSLNVKELDMVKQGDIIGYMGATGMATGSHLHFNIMLKDTSISPWIFIQK